MIKKIQFSFAIMLAITFFSFGSVAFAQTDASNSLQATSETAISADYDVSVQPVKFFDKVKLFFTFNAEKKADLLSDFSKRNFVLATQNFEQGNTAQAEVLLQKSEMDMARANIAATKIIQPEKREQAMNRMSSENAVRTAVLTEVQSRIENPVAQEALGRAITRQQIAPDVNANQNAGTRGNNGTVLGGGIGISAVNPACTPTTTPYMKVLSPNGGEEYVAGEEIAVKWNSCNVPNYIGVIIYDADAPTWHQGNPIVLASGHYDGPTENDGEEVFTIPASTSAGEYKIWVRHEYDDFTGAAYEDQSDNSFTITASGSEGSESSGQLSCSGISITSPQSNTQVTFPLTVQGVIHPVANPGPWGVFEGEAGHVVVKDGNGNVQSNTAIITLSGEWMNTNPKPFSVSIPSLTGSPYSSEVFLHFSDNNPMDNAVVNTCVIPLTI
jgi:hypothetical protein